MKGAKNESSTCHGSLGNFLMHHLEKNRDIVGQVFDWKWNVWTNLFTKNRKNRFLFQFHLILNFYVKIL